MSDPLRPLRAVSRAIAGIALVVAFADCRCRTRYDDQATKACNDEAARAAPDMTGFKRRCDDCCHERGLDAVEPGSCACGDLGVDALMK